jgi:hypothetical protein
MNRPEIKRGMMDADDGGYCSALNFGWFLYFNFLREEGCGVMGVTVPH